MLDGTFVLGFRLIECGLAFGMGGRARRSSSQGTVSKSKRRSSSAECKSSSVADLRRRFQETRDWLPQDSNGRSLKQFPYP